MSPPPTWVLLRGLGREAGHWGDFPARLAAAWPHARVLALDLPGNGHLHALRSPSLIAGMTDHARAQLQALGVEGPCRLLALSLGGMVAVDWAVRHPQQLSGCVLVNTSLRPFSAWHRRLRPGAWPALLRAALARDAAARERTVLRLTSRLRTTDDPVIDDWLALHARHPVALGNLWRQLRAAAAFEAPREAPAVALLVVTSTQDRLVDAACSRSLATHWAVPLREHGSAGHDLPLDDGDWLLRQIEAWLPHPDRGT